MPCIYVLCTTVDARDDVRPVLDQVLDRS